MSLENNTSGIGCIYRTILSGSVLIAAIGTQSMALANPIAGDPDNEGSRIVVVHTDDQVGMSGVAIAKSCLRQGVSMSQQKAMDGTQAVFMIMKYDGNGKIVGVHYGTKDVCEFLQKTPEKIS